MCIVKEDFSLDFSKMIEYAFYPLFFLLKNNISKFLLHILFFSNALNREGNTLFNNVFLQNSVTRHSSKRCSLVKKGQHQILFHIYFQSIAIWEFFYHCFYLTKSILNEYLSLFHLH